ncbi:MULTISPECIES: ribonuclease R family protein [unclassified Sphingobium]|uniref:ribonuclease R family protein n=1 Tax=unclassified Sphingobium TaxID=2611147 RepID=UPI00222511EB|nr:MULTISPECIES: VacB/RNase II family 3'-5' exoribonuclease [unclassified Sphingobium]MCW2383397.1 ribonuclease R [Sphingobium sp. B2D3B]MCW2399628.1 ribonuclease R [Sphingobium sp. B2D3C]
MAPPRKPIRPQPAGLPTRDQVLDFISNADQPAGKREIAKAFGLRGNEKIALKALLRDMADEGLLETGKARAFNLMGGVPKVTVLRVVESDGGQVIAVPERWEAEGHPIPKLRVIERGKRGALGIGDRILARTEQAGHGWVAHPMKKLAGATEQMLGVVAKDERGKLILRPVDKRIRYETPISDQGDAQPGDLVLAEKSGRPPRVTARVTDVLGDPFQPRSFSLIAIHKYGIPDVFPEEAEAEAAKVHDLPLHADAREDLRVLPIVAIDPVDARDFDDAVWAAPDDDPANEGGFKAIVAIADVSYYVRPGSALDRSARKRGNSVYFPDRVVPMLPHALSSDMCSLKAGEDRAVLACHLVIGPGGALKSWRFTRAIIRVAANIPYEMAQAAIDRVEGKPERTFSDTRLDMGLIDRLKGDGLIDDAMVPLWACWRALAKARDARGPLDLDLPERRVVLDEEGRIVSIAIRERLDAHRLIEDFMVTANVAAAKALEAKKAPVMYRVHEPPSREKLTTLKEYLETYGISLALGQVITTKTFNRLIEQIPDDAAARPQIMEQILRSQTQAYYGPRNLGHFGLSLGSYAHFTSPIRRYSDLLVHRSLVGAYGLEMPAPADKSLPRETRLSSEDVADLAPIGERISQYERRAMEAERETVDRYVAAFLAQHVGEIMACRITGVQSFGFFATVVELGGDGLVPVSTLGGEYFRYDEVQQALIGEDSGDRYAMGDRIDLRIAESDPVSGALRFEIPHGASHMAERKDRRRPGSAPVRRTGRPPNIRHTARRKGPVKRR